MKVNLSLQNIIRDILKEEENWSALNYTTSRLYVELGRAECIRKARKAKVWSFKVMPSSRYHGEVRKGNFWWKSVRRRVVDPFFHSAVVSCRLRTAQVSSSYWKWGLNQKLVSVTHNLPKIFLWPSIFTPVSTPKQITWPNNVTKDSLHRSGVTWFQQKSDIEIDWLMV